ncbi:MAG: hypothetical protein JXJ22_05085 [Bacteroidales bacterium]|nr:hypothetical protein [Bacteroidales bacterium]
MQVKGTALKSTRDFVKDMFPLKYNEWINVLPSKSREIYRNTISVSGWFPIKEGYLDPIDKIVDMFFSGDMRKGGEEIGKYSAEIALKGIYKVFLLIASPKFLIQRASRIITTYYQPSRAIVNENGPNSATLVILEFSEINIGLEYRIAGWCIRALELANSKDVKYSIDKSLAKGHESTEITFTWL